MVRLVKNTSAAEAEIRHARLGALNASLEKKLSDHSHLLTQLRQISNEIDEDISSLSKFARGPTAHQKAIYRRTKTKGTRGTPTAA